MGYVNVRQLSSAAELEKVLAIKQRDSRVGKVDSILSSTAEATKAVAVKGDHRVTVTARGRRSRGRRAYVHAALRERLQEHVLRARHVAYAVVP